MSLRGKSICALDGLRQKAARFLIAGQGAGPMDSILWEHREAITWAVRAFMLAVAGAAVWSIWRDARGAWPRIVELWKDRNHDA